MEVLAFGSYLQRKGYFEATSAVGIDSETLQPITEEKLRLGDAITNRITRRDADVIALGGVNYGKVLLLDPANLEIQSEVQVAPGRGFTPEVQLVSWPKRNRLVGYSQSFGAHELFPGRAFVIDPVASQIVEKVSLGGGVIAASETSRGAAFVVANPGEIGPARLVLLDSDGRTETIKLDQITAGFVDPGTAGESFNYSPAVVSLDNVVYVIGASGSIAAVRIKSGKVSYHTIPGLMMDHLQSTTYPATGTAGALESHSRDAIRITNSKVLITGNDTLVIRGGSHLESSQRAAQIVDLRRLRVVKTLHDLSDVHSEGRIIVGRSSRGALTALSRNGQVLYTRQGKNRQWSVFGDRLVEARQNGADAVELDIRTGEEVGSLGRLEMWPLDALAWPPHPSDMGTEAVVGF